MSRGLRVLLCQGEGGDDAEVARLLVGLGCNVNCERVADEATLEARVAHEGGDLVLYGVAGAGSEGGDARAAGALRALRAARRADPSIPFVVLTDEHGRDVAVAATRAGASDWVDLDDHVRLETVIAREQRLARERQAQRRIESELGMQAARFRALVEKSADAVCVLGPEGAIRYASPASQALFGRAPHALVGVSLCELLEREEAEKAREVLARVALEPGRSEAHELRMTASDGMRRLVRMIAINQRDDAAVDGIVLHLRDLTRLRQAEEALARSDQQLRQAQKMEAVGRLAGGVAHDFNNILSVILSYASMVLDDVGEGSELGQDLLEICNAGRRASELTHQLLAFSRRQVVEPRVVDLNAVVTRLERMYRRILGEDIALVTTLTPELGRVLIDPTALEQVVMNLVVNARDAMPRGGSLTIETSNVWLDEEFAEGHLGVKAGPHVRLTVSDTGTGMDQVTMQQIFEPFFTTKEPGRGTGLGLSTVFGIVRQAGGTIWVYSEVGLGTTFKVLFPRVDKPVTARRAPGLIADLRGEEQVLLVEDDDALRKVARGIMRRNGYRVLEARGAEEALALIADHAEPIDLLLTDIVMPGMGGPELARRARAMRPEIKILCMSGYTDDAIVRHGLLDDELAFLQKPLVPDALLRKLREVLGAKPA